MFTQPCFIRKNTERLRKELDKLGYEEYPYGTIEETCLYVDNYQDGWYDGILWHKSGDIPHYSSIEKEDYNEKDYGINCGTNQKLFLALAALRDDSDYMQYFVLDTDIKMASENCKIRGTFLFCQRYSWYEDLNEDGTPYMFSKINIPAHKATVEELIKHFK